MTRTPVHAPPTASGASGTGDATGGPPKMPEHVLLCPECDSAFVRPTRPKWFERVWVRVSPMRPVKCWHCGTRFRVHVDDLRAARGHDPHESATPPASPGKHDAA